MTESIPPADLSAGTTNGLPIPTFEDVLNAERTIRPYLPETPVVCPEILCELLDAQVYLKCENFQPIGAFKVRGGVNLVATEQREIEDGERWSELVTASTGNHGQSIAYAARLFNIPAHIFVPENPSPLKASRISRLGARLVETGRDFDEAKEAASDFAAAHGYRYVHPAMEPLLIAGVATATRELLQRVPDLDVLFVPVGAGSGACGASIVARAVNPRLRVVAVQASGAPAAYESWQTGQLTSTADAATVAEGLATRVAYSYPVAILRQLLDDFILVSDSDMEQAVRLLFDSSRQVAEEAGAAALAGAMAYGEALKGQRVGLMLSGGNITGKRLATILESQSTGR